MRFTPPCRWSEQIGKPVIPHRESRIHIFLTADNCDFPVVLQFRVKQYSGFLPCHEWMSEFCLCKVLQLIFEQLPDHCVGMCLCKMLQLFFEQLPGSLSQDVCNKKENFRRMCLIGMLTKFSLCVCCLLI